LGADSGTFITFPDHHAYTTDDLSRLERKRREHGCSWYLTTLKDAVKIDPAWHPSTPLRFLRIGLHQAAGADMLASLTRDS
jgi:tetraacyldisaccharide 4'-kinase